jgi:hypothetical protein
MKKIYLIIFCGFFIQLNLTIGANLDFDKAIKKSFASIQTDGVDLVVEDIPQGVIKSKDGKVPIKFRIANYGNVPFQGSCKIKFIFTLNGQHLTDPTINISDIEANSSREVTINVTNPNNMFLGDLSMVCIIDPDNLIPEINESNNTISKNLRIELHDIKISVGGDIAGFVGQNVNITVKIENIGNVNSGKLTVLFYKNSVTQINIWNIPSLTPGSSQSYSTSLNLSAGTYVFAASTTYSDDDNSNNLSTHALSVVTLPTLLKTSVKLKLEENLIDTIRFNGEDSIHFEIESVEISGNSVPINNKKININSNDHLTTFILYPNPNNGVFQIDNSEFTSGAKIEIFNEKGVKIADHILDENNKQIDISAHPDGIYYIIYKNGKDELRRKIVKSCN